MKVGVIVDNEYHSDVRVKREVSLLRTLGHQVFVLCLSFNKNYNYQQEEISIHPVYISRKLKDILYFFMNLAPFYEWWWQKRVNNFIIENGIEVVHTHDLYMAKCVKGGIESSKKEVTMILDLHENYPYAIQSYKWTQGFIRSILVRPKMWLKKEMKYLAFADRLVVLSKDFKDSLLKRYSFLNDEKLIVFPNVVDTVEFDKYPISKSVVSDLPSSPRVLYFGVVADRRGIFRSLKSCEELLGQGLAFSLVIIGPVDSGDKEQFFEEIKKPVFKEKLTYIPWIELSELPSYLSACDIALAPFDKNPQHESGIANKIFQYMYGGLPIIASNCKPQQELIEQFEIGTIFKTDQELTKKLKELIENKKERKMMGVRAHEVLMKEFHQDAFKPQFKQLYDELSAQSIS